MSNAADELSPERLLAEQDFVRGVLRSLIRGDELEDLVQRVWLRARTARGLAASRLRPWLARVARNLVADRRRELRRRVVRERAAARDEALPSTLDVLAREALRRRVVDAVLALPEPYRGAVLARHFDEVPLAALARRLGVREATARSWLRRGLAMLRARLDGDRELGDWRAVLAPILFQGGLVVSKSKLLMTATAVVMLGVVLWRVGESERLPAPVEPTRAGPAARQVALPSAAPGEARGPMREELVTGASLRRELRVELRVRAQGLPAAGLALELRDFDGAGSAGPPRATHALLTDAEGRAELRLSARDELRTLSVAAVSPATRLFCEAAVVAPDEAELVLSGTAWFLPCTLRGVVRDPAGVPIAGARISFNGWHAATSDGDGRYALPIGTGTDLRPLLASAPGYREELVEIAVQDDAREHELDLVLEPAATITGHVRDAQGRALAGVAVKASGSFVKHVSDADGGFVIDHLEPRTSHRIEAESPGAGRAAQIARAGDVIELVLRPGLRIAGRVRDAQGRPIAGAAIGMYRSTSGVVVKAWSARDGAFTLEDLEPGALELVVSRRGWARTLLALELSGDRDDLLVDLERGRTVRGRVLDEDGAPLAGVNVFVNLAREVDARTVGGSQQSDTEGRFAFANLPAEPCTIHARAAGWQSASQALEGPMDLEVELRLRRAASLAGRVVDAGSGAPIEEFTVSVRPRGEGMRWRLEATRHRDAQGHFAVHAVGMREGVEFDVVIDAPGHATGQATLIAALRPDRERAVIALDRGVEIVGRVLDAASSLPIAGAELSLNGPMPRVARSDAEGRFRILGCGRGAATIAVRVSGRPRSEQRLEALPETVTTHELVIRVGVGATVHGRLEGFDALASRSLFLDFDDETHAATLDADGRFTIPGIGAGTHALYLAGGEPQAVVRIWRVRVGEQDGPALVLPAHEGDGSLAVTVRGRDEGEARLVPLDPRREPLALAQRLLRFTGASFTFAGLAPGRYRVSVSAEHDEHHAEIEVAGETSLVFDARR